MYFPYLRGRQFELIALREYAEQFGSNNHIIPIIEPVKETFNSLKLALTKILDSDITPALILNPKVGEIKSLSNLEKEKMILTELKNVLVDDKRWIPAFIVTTGYKELEKHVSNHNYHSVMIICSESTNTSDQNFQSLILCDQVKYIVSKENRTLKRFLHKTEKNLIRIDDSFNAQKQNKDYLNISEEKFTEEHLFYTEDGYYGFSDYTVLENEFKEGGALPYAVAIHLTYQKDDDIIWVRHFVSETNLGRENIQGKFAEAAKKAVRFLDSENIHTNASEELRCYYNNGKGTYPGLGMVKKISIKNHLELVNSIL